MTGCRHGAKNTLDKNYLYFARELGLTLHADTEVVHVSARAEGGYRIKALAGKAYFNRKPSGTKPRT